LLERGRLVLAAAREHVAAARAQLEDVVAPFALEAGLTPAIEERLAAAIVEARGTLGEARLLEPDRGMDRLSFPAPDPRLGEPRMVVLAPLRDGVAPVPAGATIVERPQARAARRHPRRPRRRLEQRVRRSVEIEIAALERRAAHAPRLCRDQLRIDRGAQVRQGEAAAHARAASSSSLAPAAGRAR